MMGAPTRIPAGDHVTLSTMTSGAKPTAVINADDFGASSTVNEAIVRSFEAGWISSTTVMANGEGFEEACALAHANGFASSVGIHFVLDTGRPLSEPILRQARLCDANGEFRRRRIGQLMWLSPEESSCIAIELDSQIARCRRFGLPLTHFDSHHHVHEELGVLRSALSVLRSKGIHRIRIIRNLLPRRTLVMSVYTACINRYVSMLGLALTSQFGSAQEFSKVMERGALRPGTHLEVMVHPDLSDTRVVVDWSDNTPLATVVDPVLRACTLTAAHYCR